VRKLHLVGFTADREGLIFTARRGSKSGSFVVPIEDALLDTVAEAQRRRNGEEVDAPPDESSSETGRPRPKAALTPREMQARLRAGQSIADVAAEAHVDTEWVERFAIPIMAEQAQLLEMARSLTYTRPRGGESAAPLGDSVEANLAERGVIVPDDAPEPAWSAHQLDDGVWIVRVRYRSRGRAQEAVWELDVAKGQLVSRNRLATDLGYLEKGKKRRAITRPPASAAPEAGEAPPVTRTRRRPSKTTRSRPVAKRRAVSSPARRRPSKAPSKAVRPSKAGRPSKATAKKTTAKSASKTTARPAKAHSKAGTVAKAKATAKRHPATKARATSKAKAKAPSRSAKAGAAGPTARTNRTNRTNRTAAYHGATATTGDGGVSGSNGHQPPSPPSSASPAGGRVPVNRLAASRVTATRSRASRAVLSRPPVARAPQPAPAPRPARFAAPPAPPAEVPSPPRPEPALFDQQAPDTGSSSRRSADLFDVDALLDEVPSGADRGLRDDDVSDLLDEAPSGAQPVIAAERAARIAGSGRANRASPIPRRPAAWPMGAG
jgi:hypothetical protein